MKSKWIRIIALIPSAAMAFMDQSILPVALPIIQKDFGASTTSLQWAVNAYLLAMAVFILISGKIGDVIGYRKSYLIGIIWFAVFSFFCGLSPDIESLIGARAFQGIGAAMMFPAQTAMIASSFPQALRGRATGVVVSTGSIFLIMGPMVGGYLSSVASWHWIFWINLPIALLGIILTLWLLKPVSGNPKKIDLPGFFFFAFFSIGITLYFMQAQDWGWSSFKLISIGIFSLVFLFLLLLREKKAKSPFMELRLFKRPLFTALCTTITISQFVLMISVFRVIYMETILGYSPFSAGAVVALTSSPVLFFSYVGGYLSDRFNSKLPVTIGYVMCVLSFIWLGVFPAPSTWSLVGAYLLFGMGIPLILTPSYSTAMGAVPPRKLGVAFGMVATFRMFGATMGLSLIFLFTEQVQSYYKPLIGTVQSTITSFSLVNYVLGALMVLAFFVSNHFHKRESKHKLPEFPAEGWD